MQQQQQFDLRAMPFLIFGMLTGTLLFLVIACVLGADESRRTDMPDWLLGAILGSLAAGMVVARFVVAGALRGAARRKAASIPDRAARAAALEQQFCTLTLITLALLEGFAFVGLVFLMLTGKWWLLSAPLVAIALGLLFLPTRARCDAFSEECAVR